VYPTTNWSIARQKAKEYAHRFCVMHAASSRASSPTDGFRRRSGSNEAIQRTPNLHTNRWIIGRIDPVSVRGILMASLSSKNVLIYGLTGLAAEPL
jgi:hypothetical protein